MSRCPACGGDAGRRSGGGSICPACGLVWFGESAATAPAYAEGLEEGIYGGAKAGLFSSALDRFGALFPSRGRLLDVGCATGVLLGLARERGWNAEGVELAPALAAKAAAAGFRVHGVPVEKAGLAAESFEAAAVFEVFSQMADPAAAAAELRRLLKPGGALYAREFNASFHLALDSHALRGLFSPLGASPAVLHNFNFTPRSLRSLLARAGFTDIRVANSPPTAGDPYRSGGRLGGLLTGALKVLYYWLAQAVSLATFGKVLIGSSLIVTARK